MNRMKKLLASFLVLSCLLSATTLPVMAEEAEAATDPAIAEEVAGNPADAEAAEDPADAEDEDAEDPADAEEAEDPADAEEDPAGVEDAELAEAVTLTDFESKSGGEITVDGNKVTLSKKGGDHHALLKDGAAYKSFTYEADVKFIEGGSAALLFGVKDPNNVGSLWYGANIDQGPNNARIFKVGGGDATYLEITGITSKGFDFNGNIHMRLTVDDTGNCTWQVSNAGNDPIEETGKIRGWQGGYIGLLTFNSSATFSNIKLEGTPVEPGQIGEEGDPGTPDENAFVTNLAGLDANIAQNNAFTKTTKGLYSVASGKGDQFIFSTTNDKNFVYEADVTFLKPWEDGAAALTFRSNSKTDDRQMYVANLNGSTGETRVFKFGDRDIDMGPHDWVDRKDDNTYHLKVTVIGTHIVYYVDDQLVLNTADYTMHNAYYGQNDAYLSGTLGLMTWNTDVVYQNVKYTALDETNSPELSKLSVVSNDGEVDKNISFHKGQYVYISYVSNDTTSIKLDCTKQGDSTLIVTNEKGEVQDINSLPVTKDFQTYTLTSTMDNGAKVIYRLRLHRCQPDETYYNEDWRGQFHYSVKDSWANDPNGMVYYNGTYHLFYQFYDDVRWGTMHWAHATSTDLIHWTEHPIELYPDEYGVMFSGCAVVANSQTAPALFTGDETGIVIFITANGERGWDGQQKVTVAYSKDGENFEKYEAGKVILHWEEDPLHRDAFRDPKVFRYANKWFMVIAGGPLRIYSSDDLINWTPESVYGDLNTECPDLYCLPVKNADGTDAGEMKWVLSRGGLKYKIGDFKQVDGKWSFVPLAQYASTNANGMGNEDNDGIMNFGKDSYAGMTYYMAGANVDDSFTGLDRGIIEINWMNTWFCDGFPNFSDKTGHNVFNGSFNLQLELGVKKDGNNYYLTQTPITEYEGLRDTPIELTDAAITSDNHLFEDFSNDSYEIVATIKPNSSKVFGFKVRASEDEETVVKYDNGRLVIDRNKSGVLVASPSSGGNVVSQNAKMNADGTFTFHIYVDRASVEVFNNDYTVAGAMQIFPSAASRGLSVFSDDGTATGDITVYPLNTIWTNKVKVTEPIAIALSKTSAICYVDNEVTLSSSLTPGDVAQEVVYSIVSGNDIVELTQTGLKAKIKAKALGTATIQVAAKSNPDLKKECVVKVTENNFDKSTNLSRFEPNGGTWFVDDEVYMGSDGGNAFLYSDFINSDKITYKVDVKFTGAMVNLIVQSQAKNAPWNGGYALQLQDNGTVRLFDFKQTNGQDKTFATAAEKLPKKDSFYSVEINVDGQKINVKIDGKEYINTEITDANYKYSAGYAALGLFASQAEFKNFYVTTTTSRTNNFNTNLKNFEAVSGTWYPDDKDYVGMYNDNAFLYSDYINSDQFTYSIDTQLSKGTLNFVFQSQTKDPWGGCYALQINKDAAVRLFDFKGDRTLATSESTLPGMDSYHIEIQVKGQDIAARINGTEYINTKVTDAERLYNKGYVALGMYNAEAKYQNFFVSTMKLDIDADSDNSIGPKVKVSNITEGTDAVTVQVAKANNAAPATIFNLSKASAEAGFEVNEGSVVTVWDGKVTFANGKPVQPPVSQSILVDTTNKG